MADTNREAATVNRVRCKNAAVGEGIHMEIKKLYDQDSVTRSYGARKQATVGGKEDGTAAGVAQDPAASDTVNISTLSRDLSRVSSILDQDEADRADRVAELKKQIADGSYSVSSTDVAGSLISFAADSAPVREV